MNWIRDYEDGCYVRLSFFLLSGAVLGTVFLNGMGDGMKEEIGTLESSLVSSAAFLELSFPALFGRVLLKRLPELFLVFLMEMTPAAGLLLGLAAGYLGFSTAVMVSAVTMEAGLWGICRYAILIFPQCLFYVPVLYILLYWIPAKRERLKPAAAMFLTGAVFLGAAAEAFLNPWAAAVFL